uniref:Uncharacterized protein n=1 Tax=Haptolina ericina TaxID=156174 RepID=A0A7S3B8R3_9EUKA
MERLGDQSFIFNSHAPIRVKGYSNLVTIYSPEPDSSEPAEDQLAEESSECGRRSSPTKSTLTRSDVVLMKMDQCSFSGQMLLKLCSALAISSRAQISKSVLAGLHAGTVEEVDETIKGLIVLKLLHQVGWTQMDQAYEFVDKAHANVVYGLMLQAQRSRIHTQLADWYRRRMLLRLEEEDTSPDDLIAMIDTLSEQLVRSGDILAGAQYLCAAARIYGEAHLPLNMKTQDEDTTRRRPSADLFDACRCSREGILLSPPTRPRSSKDLGLGPGASSPAQSSRSYVSASTRVSRTSTVFDTPDQPTSGASRFGGSLGGSGSSAGISDATCHSESSQSSQSLTSLMSTRLQREGMANEEPLFRKGPGAGPGGAKKSGFVRRSRRHSADCGLDRGKGCTASNVDNSPLSTSLGATPSRGMGASYGQRNRRRPRHHSMSDVAERVTSAQYATKYKTELMRRLSVIASMLHAEGNDSRQAVFDDVAYMYKRYWVYTIDVANSVASSGHKRTLIRALGSLLQSLHVDPLDEEGEQLELDRTLDWVAELLTRDRTTNAITRVRDAVTEANDSEIESEVLDVVVIAAPGDRHRRIAASPGAASELALILAHTMQDVNLVNLKGVVACGSPARARARFARGTLDALNMENVPVSIGCEREDGSVPISPEPKAERPTGPAVDAGALNRPPSLCSASKRLTVSAPFELGQDLAEGSGGDPGGDPFSLSVNAIGWNYLLRDVEETSDALLQRLYTEAADHSLNILAMCSLTDLANFIRDHHDIFVAKTAGVVVMGGVEEASLGDDHDMLLPDLTSHENSYDPEASSFVFHECQALGIQMTVVTSIAASTASMPAFIFDELASTGHPIALRMRDAQIREISSMWDRACLPAGHPDRRGLPDSCERKWFSATFCGGKNLSNLKLRDSAKIWPYVSTLALYDPLAFVAVSHATLERFLEVSAKVVNGTEHLVVGSSSEAPGGAHPGVRDATLLRSFLLDAFSHSLTKTFEHVQALTSASSTAPPSSQRRASIAQRWRAKGTPEELSRRLDGPRNSGEDLPEFESQLRSNSYRNRISREIPLHINHRARISGDTIPELRGRGSSGSIPSAQSDSKASDSKSASPDHQHAGGRVKHSPLPEVERPPAVSPPLEREQAAAAEGGRDRSDPSAAAASPVTPTPYPMAAKPQVVTPVPDDGLLAQISREGTISLDAFIQKMSSCDTPPKMAATLDLAPPLDPIAPAAVPDPAPSDLAMPNSGQ